MATYLTTTEDLTTVANAIRTKGGTAAQLSFPNGMATAIANIPTASSPTLQSKSVTYTSNGSATVTADAGYDGLSSVDVTVNVSGGGGGTCQLTLTTSGFSKFDEARVYYVDSSGTPDNIFLDRLSEEVITVKGGSPVFTPYMVGDTDMTIVFSVNGYCLMAKDSGSCYAVITMS